MLTASRNANQHCCPSRGAVHPLTTQATPAMSVGTGCPSADPGDPTVVYQDITQAKAAPAVGGDAEPAGVTTSVLGLHLEPGVPRLTHQIDERRHGVAGDQ